MTDGMDSAAACEAALWGPWQYEPWGGTWHREGSASGTTTKEAPMDSAAHQEQRWIGRQSFPRDGDADAAGPPFDVHRALLWLATDVRALAILIRDPGGDALHRMNVCTDIANEMHALMGELGANVGSYHADQFTPGSGRPPGAEEIARAEGDGMPPLPEGAIE